MDGSKRCSSTFKLEWPPHSGKVGEFPEMDRVGWFGLDEAKRKIKAAQIPLGEMVSDLVVQGRTRHNISPFLLGRLK